MFFKRNPSFIPVGLRRSPYCSLAVCLRLVSGDRGSLEEKTLSVVQLQSAELQPPLRLYTVVGADVVLGLPLNCSQTMPGMFLGAFSIQVLSSTLSKPSLFFLSQMDSPLPPHPIWTHFSVSHFSLLVYPPFISASARGAHQFTGEIGRLYSCAYSSCSDLFRDSISSAYSRTFVDACVRQMSGQELNKNPSELLYYQYVKLRRKTRNKYHECVDQNSCRWGHF